MGAVPYKQYTPPAISFQRKEKGAALRPLQSGRKQDETPHLYGSANLHPNATGGKCTSAVIRLSDHRSW